MTEQTSDTAPFPIQVTFRQTPPLIEVIQDRFGKLIAKPNLVGSTASSQRGTGTETETSRTSGTTTRAAVSLNSLPESMRTDILDAFSRERLADAGLPVPHDFLDARSGRLNAVDDSDGDNSEDSDKDWDAVIDQDTDRGEIFSGTIQLHTPFGTVGPTVSVNSPTP